MNNQYKLSYVALEITLACNMRCLHCGSAADGSDRKDALSFGQWCRIIDDLNILGVESITLSGGEPFVYPKWREMFWYINKVNPKIIKIAISNAYNLTEEDVKFLKNVGLHHLAISIDGNEEIHDFIRQTNGSFKKSNQVMDWCEKYRLKYSIVTSINKLNFSVRKEILNWVLNRKFTDWQVQAVNAFGRAGRYAGNLTISLEQYAQFCEELAEWKNKYKDILRIDPADSMGYCHPVTDTFLEDDTEWQGCNAGICVLGIQSDGIVTGCLSLQDKFFTEQFADGKRLNSLKERSLIDIWNDDSCFPYTRDYEAYKIEGNCKDCDSAEQCKAGCLGMAYSLHKSIYQNSYCYKNIKGQCGK